MDILRRGHRVVGVDFSREQLLGARMRCPQALFAELMGAPVFYDAWPEATSLRMLRDAGLSIVGHHFQPIEEGGAEGHLTVLVANRLIVAPNATGTT